MEITLGGTTTGVSVSSGSPVVVGSGVSTVPVGLTVPVVSPPSVVVVLFSVVVVVPASPPWAIHPLPTYPLGVKLLLSQQYAPSVPQHASLWSKGWGSPQ